MSLVFPLKEGVRKVLSRSLPKLTRANDDVSLIRCVGLVKRPQIQLSDGIPVWQCRLLLPQIGVSAAGSDSLIVGKEHMLLKCTGDLWANYCTSILYDGATVAVVGAAIQRPRYVAIHSTYRYDTEIHVGMEGFVTLVGSRP